MNKGSEQKTIVGKLNTSDQILRIPTSFSYIIGKFFTWGNSVYIVLLITLWVYF